MWDEAKRVIKKEGGINKFKYTLDKTGNLIKRKNEKIIRVLKPGEEGEISTEYDTKYVRRPQFDRIPDSGVRTEAPKNFYEMFSKPKTFTKEQLDEMGIEY